MAEINIGGELVPKTMAKKVAKAEYVYDPNQGGKRQSEINEELYQSKKYTDVYIGAGATSSDVMVAANHHDTVLKDSAFLVTANSNYLWVILPSAYSPILAIGGIAVPIYLSGTTTVENVTYNIYKSNNTYRGSFSVNLL